MKKHIIRTLSVCIALLLLSACRQEQDGLAVADESAASVQVSFTLTTASGNASTRVGTDELGTGYENYIDITNNNFRFLLFDTKDDKFVYSFTPQSVTPAGASGEYTQTYEVEGEMPEEYADFNYKVVVLANWPDYPEADELVEGKTTIKDICSVYAYQYTASFVPSEEHLIPFYGVATISTTLRPDISTNLGTIDLLRALCKVEVKCSADGFTLKEVKLNKYSTKGMCAPLKVYNNTKEDWEKNEQIHLPQDNTVGASLSLSNPDGTFIAYVPEYNNAVLKDSYLEVTLTDANNKEVTLKSPNIYFKNYTDGSPVDGSDYDLIRNHWYQFDITKVDDGELIVQYRALPWNLVESSIGYAPQPASTTVNPFADEVSYEAYVDIGSYILLPRRSYASSRNTTRILFNGLYNDPRLGDEEVIYCFVLYPQYNSAHDALEDDLGGATYYFQLTGPEGATWEAHLTNNIDFTFSTREDNYFSDSEYESTEGTTVYKVTHGIAREKPYVLQINPVNRYTKGTSFDDLTKWGKNIWEEGKNVETEFYITVKLTDGTEYELNINPSYEESSISDKIFPYKEKRRFAGTDTRIWIRHLRAQRGGTYGENNIEYTWGWPDLAKNVSPTETENENPKDNFAWWRVNQYWNDNYDPEYEE